MSMRVLRHLSLVAVVMSIVVLGGGIADRPLPAAAQEEPRLIELAASPERINPGECAIVEWAVPLTGDWPLTLGDDPVEPHGHREFCPQATTRYTLSVQTPEGVVSREVTILVGDGPDDEGRFRGEEPWPGGEDLPVYFQIVDPQAIPRGTCAGLAWAVGDAGESSVIVNGEVASREGQIEICPQETTRYELIVERPEGPEIREIILQVGDVYGEGEEWEEMRPPEMEGEPPEGPTEVAVSLSADPDTIPRGACASLNWEVNPPGEWMILLDGQTVAAQGSRQACPEDSMVYELLVEGPGVSLVRQATLHVGEGPGEDPLPPEPLSPPPQAPAPAAGGADVRPSNLFPQGGTVWTDISNYGHDTLTNNKVEISVSGCGAGKQYALSIAPGQTQTIDTGCQLAAGSNSYTVSARAIDFTDPDPGNNSYTGTLDAGAAPPGPSQPPQPPQPPKPPGKTSGADVRPSDLFPKGGNVWTRITNDGHDTLTNNKVEISVSGCGAGKQHALSIAPGQTQMIDTACKMAAGKNSYTVTVKAVDFTDPNGGNNSHTETLDAGAAPPPPPGGSSSGTLTADLALTDIFPVPAKEGELHDMVYVRITNNGPDKLQNVDITIGCETTLHTYTLDNPVSGGAVEWKVIDHLDPGQTKEYRTISNVPDDLTKEWAAYTCKVTTVLNHYDTKVNDPKPGNNTYSETIPPPP